jgi:eukaryotic-like serine/threonine-protein kinase
VSGEGLSLAESNTIVGGKYRLLQVLGRGGMGTVYEARHEVIGRRVAIKFMHAELAARPEIMARFRREAQAAGALENENIAAVTDFGVAEDGAPYIVMEFLPGEDLSRLLTRLGPLPVPRAIYALIQACRGLEAAHAHGIIHRDLKPENLLVTKRGDGSDLIKVLDFGIAKLRFEGDTGSSTRTGMTLGTPFYMPPEQARGQKDIDHRADIYALGVILYEILAGRKPHDGDGYNAIMYQILTQPPARLETLRAGLPPGLADVVHKAMAFEPGDRFQHVTELSSALAQFADRAITPLASGERAAFAPTSFQTPPAVHPTARIPAVTPNTSAASETPAPPKSSRAAVLLVFGVVSLLAAGGAALLLRKSPASEPAAHSAEAAKNAPQEATVTASATPLVTPSPAPSASPAEVPAPQPSAPPPSSKAPISAKASVTARAIAKPKAAPAPAAPPASPPAATTQKKPVDPYAP